MDLEFNKNNVLNNYQHIKMKDAVLDSIVPMTVPYPGVLQWPLLAMYYSRAAVVLR